MGRFNAGVSLSNQPTWAEAAREADPTLESGGGGVDWDHLQWWAGGLARPDGGASLFAAVMEAIVVHQTLRALCRCDKRYLVLEK